MVTALDTKFENLVTNYRDRETQKCGRGRVTNTPHDNICDFISRIPVQIKFSLQSSNTQNTFTN